MKSFKKTLTICILLCIFCIAGIAGAQSLETIKSIKLDTTKLTLAAGNNYTFYPQFTVENPRGIYTRNCFFSAPMKMLYRYRMMKSTRSQR